jgi:hypothetical protein
MVFFRSTFTDARDTVHTVASDESRQTSESAPLLTDAHVCKNRAYMTIVHYVVSYPRWSFSLFLLLARCTLPDLPSPADGMAPAMHALRVLVSQESREYQQCVSTAFQRTIPQFLQVNTDRENQRIRTIQDSNSQILSSAQTTASSCMNTTLQARGALQTVLYVPFVTNQTICTPQDHQNVTQILGSNTKLLASNVSNILGAYMESTRASMSNVANYSSRRAQYDYNYFVGVKLNATLGMLDGFVQVPTLSVDQLKLVKELRAAVQVLVDALNDAHFRVDSLGTRLLQFKTSLEGFQVQYSALYMNFHVAADFVRGFLPPGVTMPGYFDMGNVPNVDLLMPLYFAIPDFKTPMANIDGLVSEYIKQSLELIANLLATASEAATTETKTFLEELYAHLREALTLKDYNPPHFVGSSSEIRDPHAELDFLNRLGDATTNQALAAVGLLPNIQAADLKAPLFSSDSSASSPMFNNSSTRFGYLEPMFPTFSVPKFILAILAWAYVHNWIVDILLQLFRLWRLKTLHEQNAQPDLPEIDYSVVQGVEIPVDGGSHQQTNVGFLKVFMTPWMALGLILLPLAGLGLGLYLPYVHNKCIVGREGTFVARHLVAPLYINQANTPGVTLHTSAELVCQQGQQRLCDRMYADSDLIFRRTKTALITAQSNFNSSVDTTRVLSRCIDTVILDAMFETNCCGLEGYGTNDSCSSVRKKELCSIDNSTSPQASFRPVGEYLANDACSSEMGGVNLVDSHFDCTVLENVCNSVPCSGVDSDLVLYWTVDAVCQVEVYLMGCCFWVLGAVYHMFMIGLGCSQILNGIKKVRWRSLRPDGIVLRTQMTEDGHLVKGKAADERISRIREAITGFERVGWFQIYFGGFELLAWFVSFCVLRHLLALLFGNSLRYT